jgi:ABC-type nickel/cobalt efflux system permease component RcnA
VKGLIAQHQALRTLPDLAHRAPVDLQHHGVDHQPDEHGHDHVHVGDLEGGDGGEDLGQRQAQAHAGEHAQADPDAQVTFEQAHGGSVGW